MQKADVIIVATEAGIFRARTLENVTERALQYLEDEGKEGQKAAFVPIVEAEWLKRKEAKREAVARKVARQEATEALPLTGGTHGDALPQLVGESFVFTVAQNNTEVHQGFFDALQVFCGHFGARLIVGKTAYNKTGFCQPEKDGEGLYYDPRIPPSAFVDHAAKVAGDLVWLGNANIIPTAKHPTRGYEGATKPGVSIVLPTTASALQCVAALKGAKVKRIFGTGSLTLANFVQRKAGQTAWHNCGALFVLRNGESWEAFQLEAMDETGAFFHGLNMFSADGMKAVEDAVEAIQFGDFHAEHMPEAQLLECVALLKVFKPRFAFLHDVADFRTRNHHNKDDPFFMLKQHAEQNSVAGDLQKIADTIRAIAENVEYVKIIESNHDLALSRYIREQDWREDIANCLTYLTIAKAWAEAIAYEDNEFNLLQYALEEIGGGVASNVVFHKTDESVTLANGLVQAGCHGHDGPNGSRGSPTAFSKLGVRMNTGHTHSPSIVGPVFTAGVTSKTLDMGYNKGPSSWAYAHVLTYKNGQRQIIFM